MNPSNPVIDFWNGVHDSDIELMLASLSAEPDILKKLRERNLWIVCDAGKYASPEVINLLVKIGADLNQQDSNGWTGLCWTVAYGKYDAAKTLLELGANPNLHCPIFGIVRDKNKDPIAMAQLLLDHGANVNELFLVEGLPPQNILSRAMELGQHDLVEFLKTRGAQLPGKLPSGTPAGAAPRVDVGDYSADILAHFRKRFGKPHASAIVEIVPTSAYPIAIHYIPPTWWRPLTTLFTVGLSRYTMRVPRGAEAYQLAELMLVLPKSWPTPEESLQKPEWAWPIEWLRRIAAYPHENDTWLGGPFTTLANGDPPRPLGPGVKFSAWAMAAADGRKNVVKCRDSRRVQLYHLYPLYAEEYDVERREGLDAFTACLGKVGLPEYIDLARPNGALPR